VVVVGGLLQKGHFEFLLVYLATVDAYFEQQVHCKPNLHFLNYFAVALVPDLTDQFLDQTAFYLRVQHDMVLKLTSLHLLNGFEFYFRHVILVHVQQDVLYHDDTQFLIGPQLV